MILTKLRHIASFCYSLAIPLRTVSMTLLKSDGDGKHRTSATRSFAQCERCMLSVHFTSLFAVPTVKVQHYFSLVLSQWPCEK